MIKTHKKADKAQMLPEEEYDSLASQQLRTETFPDFYRKMMGLRFPLMVADVIEMRDTVNHAADSFMSPPLTPDYREFLEAIQSAIDSFGIEKKRHSDRLIKIFTMLRNLHYEHSIHSRDKEFELRQLQSDNRQGYYRSMRYGVISIIGAVVGSLVWMGLPQAGWLIKASTLVLSYITLDYFHSLSTLDRELKILTLELNATLRDRIDSMNWRTLIHKLSLLLGFKEIAGVDVFLMNSSGDFGQTERLYH